MVSTPACVTVANGWTVVGVGAGVVVLTAMREIALDGKLPKDEPISQMPWAVHL